MNALSVYIETSVVSYLTARPSNDLLAAAWQRVTMEWWDTRRHRFLLYTSEIVADEASRGDPNAARHRLQALSGVGRLAVTEEVTALARAFVDSGVLPARAVGDAFHVAIAAVHGIDTS